MYQPGEKAESAMKEFQATMKELFGSVLVPVGNYGYNEDGYPQFEGMIDTTEIVIVVSWEVSPDNWASEQDCYYCEIFDVEMDGNVGCANSRWVRNAVSAAIKAWGI